MQARQIAVSKGKPFLRDLELEEIPPRHVRVETLFSGVSAGTELAIIRRNALERDVVVPLGYQAVGRVVAVGADVKRLTENAVVACYGAPFVSHASLMDVPERLCTPLADGTTGPEFAFCGLGTIALHAMRLGNLQLGEVVAVVGLGALGNLVAQLAQRAGARVVGIETNEARRQAAEHCGVRAVGSWADLRREVEDASDQWGADVVFLVTNACGNELFEQCAKLVRLRGKIVIVGAAEAVFPRDMLFEKEAEVIVSRAGGPGRYDLAYERGEYDYPYPYVRWTESRNLHEFVRLAQAGAVALRPLVSVVAPVNNFADIYAQLASNAGNIIGAVFEWEPATK
jgi:2-desacetyl-2-hydroxyethyl bacteriochlorophyllide A dehydrogenase